jgi:hypothetical protein
MDNSNNKPCVKCGSTERYKPKPGKKLGDCKACNKARNKTWQQVNPEKVKSKVDKYRKSNPEKWAAKVMVNSTVQQGYLPRVSTCDCVDCGIQAAEYHHEDYNKPLEVVALCKKCHVKRHHPSTNELTNHSHQT